MRAAKHLCLLPFMIASLYASSALAVDGVIEINDAAAGAGGVTPGDTPGYPVTIDRPGSYRLTGHLSVSSANNTVVEITANDVTLDLNGFSIRCLYLFIPCAGNGTGRGISGDSSENTTVRNGSVVDMGEHGIYIGNGSRVEDVTASNNGGKGVRVGLQSSVVRSTILDNAGTGIDAGGTSRVAENVIEGNGGAEAYPYNQGISCGNYCVVQGNVVKDSVGTGINTGATSTVRGNTVNNSGGHGVTALSGSAVIENSISGNGRCGIRGGGNTGYANNVLTYNNGSVTTDNRAVVYAIEIGTNMCGNDTNCSEGAANQCS